MIDDFKKPRSAAPKSLPPKPTLTEQAETPQTDSFQTPEAIAASELETPSVNLDVDTVSQPSVKSKSAVSKLALHWPPGKKEIIAFTILVLLLGGGGLTWAVTHKVAKPVVAASPKIITKVAPVVPKSTTVASTLSGLQVDPTFNARPVTGVMIENSVDARPQSGLSQASVVFEAIAEGGITRFLALFQDTQPTNVGPIRSARPYYEQWALGFDAGYAHVGGSPEALADIKSWNVRDLDQFANGDSYHRISSRDAPHNVYTGVDALTRLEVSKGYTSSTFTGFVRKAAEAPAKVPTAKSINIAISGPTYNVHYDYNAATNSYNRSEAGAAHIDANTNTQISPKVVIALAMPYSLEADGYHSDYSTIGSGPMYVFQDGTVTAGQWSKSSSTSQFTFTTTNGKPLGLNPGQTWITAVSGLNAVSSAP